MAAQGLPLGYASNAGSALNLEGLKRVLTCDISDNAHTILIYFARENLKGGDEAKLTRLVFDYRLLYSNEHFAHVVDIQPMYKKAFPNFNFGKQGKSWLHNNLAISLYRP